MLRVALTYDAETSDLCNVVALTYDTETSDLWNVVALTYDAETSDLCRQLVKSICIRVLRAPRVTLNSFDSPHMLICHRWTNGKWENVHDGGA